jgi:hypothetical protein
LLIFVYESPIMHAAKINNFLKKKNYLFYFLALAVFFAFYYLAINQIKTYNDLKKNNFNSFLDSDEFSSIKKLIFENLNSPYREYNYTVQNNDTIEKILKKYDVTTEDINNIASAVVKKKTIKYIHQNKD